MKDHRFSASLVIGLIAVILTSLYAWRTLADYDYDPTVFIAFGEEEYPSRAYAEQTLGDVHLRPEAGHDGKFFFILANDPFLVEPHATGAALDRPLYRSQRILYPMIAGIGGLLPPEAITWTMLGANILAMGLGSWAVGRIASHLGGSPWWALAFALNVGFISELNIGGAGVVAAAAAFSGIAALMRGRIWLAALAIAAACLSREAMVIVALGSAWWLWREQKHRDALTVLALPIVAVSLWAAYTRLRFGWSSGVTQVKEIGIPLGGFVGAIDNWMTDPVGFAAGFAILLLFLLYVRRMARSSTLVGSAFAGFIVLGILFTERVWRSYFDITRAIAPVITAFVLIAFAWPRSRQIDDGGVLERQR